MKFNIQRLSIGNWSPFKRANSETEKRSQRGSSSTIMVSPISAEEPDSRCQVSMANDYVKLIANGVAARNGSSELRQAPSFRLIELAQTIFRETNTLNKYLREHEYPSPSFDVDAPLDFPSLPENIQKTRQIIIDCTQELRDLVVGPTETIRWMSWDHNNSLSLHAVYHYEIAKSFPVNETATYAQIAQTVNLDEVNIRRFLRHAMTNRIFKEVSPGVVAHTAASRVLAKNAPMQDWVGFCIEDMFPAASRTIDALTAHPSASSPLQTGFCVANNTTDIEPMFATISRSTARAQRFSGAMQSLIGGEGYEISHLLDNYDWGAIDALPGGGTVVDVGGSHGFVCVELAQRWKHIKFVVQDLPAMVGSAPRYEGDVGERVTFMAHDFMTEQPVKGADVYFFRWILHNQSDASAIPMLRALIPALKRGARILINDHVLSEPGQERPWDEKIMRTMDLVMLTLLNAQERSAREFEELFRKADKQFVFKGVMRPKGCRMSIVEAVWNGEDTHGRNTIPPNFDRIAEIETPTWI